MAIIRSVAVSKARGKAGSTRFSRYRGATVIAEQPLSVANPQTIGQQIMRTKMRGATQLALGYNKLFASGLHSFRVHSRSSRGSLLTTRSQYMRSIMRGISGADIEPSMGRGDALVEVLAVLQDRNIPNDPSSTGALSIPVRFAITDVEVVSGGTAVDLSYELINESSEPVIVNDIFVYFPIFSSNGLLGGVVDGGSFHTSNSVMLIPGEVINFEHTIEVTGQGTLPSDVSFYKIEGVIEGTGIVTNGVLPFAAG